MRKSETWEEINRDRRRLLGAAAMGTAAAGATGLFPFHAAAAEDTMRIFRVDIPRGATRRSAPAHRDDAVARSGDGHG